MISWAAKARPLTFRRDRQQGKGGFDVVVIASRPGDYIGNRSDELECWRARGEFEGDVGKERPRERAAAEVGVA